MKPNILISILIVLSVTGCCKVKYNNDLQNIDNLTSSEYKLLLNPEQFDDYKHGFANYWNIIQEVAEDQNIPILEDEDPLSLGLKHIGFFDTENMDFNKNGYLLRRRIVFKNGQRKPGVEFTLKFRNSKSEVANAADVNIADGYTPKDEYIELESDIVYHSDSKDNTKTVFTIQNSIILDENQQMTVGGLAKIYPILATFGVPLDEELKLVANNEPIEHKVSPGKLDFGDGLSVDMDITIWVAELEGEILRIPEFSFDHPFHKDKKYTDESMKRCKTFMNKLEKKYPEWVIPGKSKSSYLFEHALNNN